MRRRKLTFPRVFRRVRLPRFAGRLGRFLLKSQILTLFLALCVLGIIVGLQTRPARDTFPTAELFEQMSVVSYRESPSDTTTRFVAELTAGGKVFQQYDIEAGRFLPPSRSRSYGRTITGTHYGPLRVRGHVGYGFWLDVPRSSRRILLPSQFDELYRTTLDFVKPISQITGVLGILSGYSVGYRIGTWNSSLKSRAAQERVLATPGIGRTIAREAWRRVLLEPLVMTGEDDAERFAAVTGTHRIYANFFRLALDDSDGFVPREADRLAALGRTEEARAMREFSRAVRHAAADSVPLASADFEAIERWAALLDRRGHWVVGAIPPPGEERIKLMGALAWYGLAPPAPHVDRVWVGPRMLVRTGDAEGFVADEVPATGVGCPLSWRERLREERTGASANASAWLADRPEFTALIIFGRRIADGVAHVQRQLAALRGPDPAAEALVRDRAGVTARFASRMPGPAVPDSGWFRNVAFPIASPGGGARLTLIASDSSAGVALARVIQDALARVDSLMDPGIESSEVARLNREAALGPAGVHPEVAAVLAAAHRTWRESERAFDVTLGPLKSAWGLSRGPRRVPTPLEVEEALRYVGGQRWTLDPVAATVAFQQPGVMLDLDGIATGHAVDAAAESLRARGVRDALVERSGCARAIGAATGGEPWSVPIADPRGRVPEIGRLRLSPGQACAATGRYEPLVIPDGGIYGSILDPRTGQPAQGLIGVVAVANDALTAAAWSNALFVLGPHDARIKLRARGDLSAILIEPGASGTDVIWIDADLKDRFVLDPRARGPFRIATF